MDDSIVALIQKTRDRNYVGYPYLYLTARLRSDTMTTASQAVIAGTALDRLGFREQGWKIDETVPISSLDQCLVGVNLAKRFDLQRGSLLEMQFGANTQKCSVADIVSDGGPEDDQAFLPLERAQQLAGTLGRISLVKTFVFGTPSEISSAATALQRQFPDVEVRPVRQFTEGEARLYGKISGVLTATVAVVLILTALCVMAAMTNVAMERKNDVGLMKAIGGSVRRVLRLFLAEAALLGLAGGLIGAAVGIVISIGLGKAVFGVAAQPRLIVYPISVALTVMVALLAAYPLRRLAHIRPASVFRGEE